MAFWLMKTEPDVFAFADLLLLPRRTTPWEGVRNYQARNYMRDQFAPGDGVFVYHSSCEVPAIVGVGKVVKGAYPDLTALNPKSPYYDEKSAAHGVSRWVMVDIAAIEEFSQPVTLRLIKETPHLASMIVAQKGSRLSIQPVQPDEWKAVRALGKPRRLAAL